MAKQDGALIIRRSIPHKHAESVESKWYPTRWGATATLRDLTLERDHEKHAKCQHEKGEVGPPTRLPLTNRSGCLSTCPSCPFASTCRSHHATVRCSSGVQRTAALSQPRTEPGVTVASCVARPAGRVEGPDIVSPRHVPERDAGSRVKERMGNQQSELASEGANWRPREQIGV